MPGIGLESLPSSYVSADKALASYHWDVFDTESVAHRYPAPPHHLTSFASLDRDELDALRLERARRTVRRAWERPFYRRLWADVGFEPGDLGSLSDLEALPAFTVHDIRASLDEAPPFGLHQAPVGGGIGALPHQVQFSGGTTGVPRPVLYSVQDRTIVTIMMARTLWAQGVRPGSTVVVAWAYGPHAAAVLFTDALTRWLGSLVIPTSTGVVTPTSKQVLMASHFGATHFMATSDYLLHLARTAEQEGYDLQDDFAFEGFPTIGDGDAVERVWGRPAYNNYGTYETSSCATECVERDGMHIWEDAFLLDVVDVESGRVLPEGHRGNVVVTSLFSEAFPLVRFNTMDMSTLRADDGPCPCGLPFRKLSGFEGRSDTMVKLRGINVWPEALGEVVAGHDGTNGEYFCIVSRQADRDEMTLLVETPASDTEVVTADIALRVHQKLGVKVRVEARPVDALEELTGRGQTSKLRRFEDRR